MRHCLAVKLVRRFVYGVCLLSTFGALAVEPRSPQINLPGTDFAASLPAVPAADQKVVVRSEKIANIARMQFDLPQDSVRGAAELNVVVRRGERVVIRETIAMPEGHRQGAATIAVLANHPKELAEIRKIEASRPGRLRFSVSAGERVIVDVPFAEADIRSARLAGSVTVGSTRLVDVNIPQPRNAVTDGMVPDPECDAGCMDTFYECYAYCDERGDCSYCQDDYAWCASQCPQTCVEPKLITTFQHWGYVGSVNYGIHCMLRAYDNQKYYYQLWQDIHATQQIRRTEHCNGSYTDEVLSTVYSYSFCYEKLIPSSWCISAEGVVGPNDEC